ncbi:Fimbrial biogenesis protein [Sterolibacterium denitrificans]|uniref:Type IV pilus biogenesis and competence protein PilQ n=1 Tax=Sterolibacterium denitrificans TaxID=157592 RepID=A0A7Z7MVP3_9PROT|nr:type IV pilus secretin family protein [Sterolibacterium denitrificans]SMB26501.1 Fimbrial biogenesis protein [Sterolibacterium denitrificans]
MSLLRTTGRYLASVAILCGLASASWAQQASDASAAPAVNSIDTLQVSQSEGVTIVKLTLKQPPAVSPASFSIASPPRIAFDFPATLSALARNVEQVNQGDLRSINVIQVGNRTRMVLNLNRMASYDTRVDGSEVYVTLAAAGNSVGSTAVAAPAAAPVSHFSTAAPQQMEATVQGLRDINFRRGRGGEARIMVDLSDPNIGIDLQKQGKNLLVTFKRAELPRHLSRRMDVTDFATPVTAVDTKAQGGNVLMTITPHGLWEHNAYQSDNQFVVEIRPIVEDANQLVPGSSMGMHGEKLSLNFQNIEVRAVLQVIADFTNYNIITSDAVTGNVTLRLKDVPWDQALDIILQAKGLGMRKKGNVIWIAPDKEIIERDEYQAQSRQASSISEPMQTQTFRLSYAKAEDVSKLLTGEELKKSTELQRGGTLAGVRGEVPQIKGAIASATERGSYLSPFGAVAMDVRTNQLFVTDYPQYLERVKTLISQLDKPVKQVLIEARIVSAEDNFGRSLGVRLGFNDASSLIDKDNKTTRARVGGSLEGLFAQTGQDGAGGGLGAASLAQTNSVNLPAMKQGGADPSRFAISLFRNGVSNFINLELQAAETDGRLKSIASPRVVTADSQQAQISQGVEVPFTVITDKGTPQTEFKKAELKLAVTPQITTDGTVILDLEVSNDEVGAVYIDGVSINTKNIKTKVTVDNGGTVVLGGVYQQAEQETINKVPMLGDLPILGNLFKSNSRSQSRKELLVFITPKIIDEQIQAAVR